MVNWALLMPLFVILITFFCAIFLIKWWIKRVSFKGVDLVARDMNKPGNKFVAEMGGLPVIASFVFGALLYVGYRTFIKGDVDFNINILAALLTVVLAGVVGMMDDLLGWKKGVSSWYRIFIFFLVALPMMMTSLGKNVITIPLLGDINFGLWYPLVIIPIAISGAANGFNLLAGYNGLEGGLGVIILTVLGFVSWYSGLAKLAIIAFLMVAALLAFLIFNWYPAKVFPGNILSCSVGALVAVMAIFGSMEFIALILFIPYFMDLLFLFRARTVKVEAFAKPKKDKSLELPYNKCYDTTHLSLLMLKNIKGKVYEWEVVSLILGFEVLLGVLVLVIVL